MVLLSFQAETLGTGSTSRHSVWMHRLSVLLAREKNFYIEDGEANPTTDLLIFSSRYSNVASTSGSKRPLKIFKSKYRIFSHFHLR